MQKAEPEILVQLNQNQEIKVRGHAAQAVTRFEELCGDCSCMTAHCHSVQAQEGERISFIAELNGFSKKFFARLGDWEVVSA